MVRMIFAPFVTSPRAANDRRPHHRPLRGDGGEAGEALRCRQASGTLQGLSPEREPSQSGRGRGQLRLQPRAMARGDEPTAPRAVTPDRSYTARLAAAGLLRAPF